MLRNEILKELYEQVNLNMISHIRKGQVERWEEFITEVLSVSEIQKTTQKMTDKAQKLSGNKG